MTKTELISTYTVEQLAETVVAKNDEIQRLKRDVSRLADENGELQIELDKYNNYILPRCTKEAKEMIDRSRFGEVMIVTYEEWGNKKKFGKRNKSFLETIDKIREYTDARAEDLAVCGADLLAGEVKGLNYVLDRIKGFELEEGEIEDLKELIAEKEKEIEKLNKNFADIFMQAKECTDANLYNINRFERQVDEFQDREEKLQSEVEKYRKAFEDAKKERDCQVAEYQKKIEELERDLEYKDGTKMFETLMKNTSGEAKECLARHMYENLRCVFRHEKTADEVSISDFSRQNLSRLRIC